MFSLESGLNYLFNFVFAKAYKAEAKIITAAPRINPSKKFGSLLAGARIWGA